MNSENLVELRDIHLAFGDKKILNGVNLAVKPKEILVIMGASGGGKSTLLSILLQLLHATSGTVLFEGKELTALPRRELNKARTEIGMVFQQGALISSMTVGTNLALPLEELSERKPEEIDKAIDEKIENGRSLRSQGQAAFRAEWRHAEAGGPCAGADA